jgi:RNA polymerase sigma-70 factor, ECF subfamily
MRLDRSQINGLMDRASSGEDAAFGALASAVQDELFRTVLALGLDREDAAEATQEILLRAYSRRHTWQTGSDALAWLCGIAVNVVREGRRRRRRLSEAVADLARQAQEESERPTDADGWEPAQLRRLLAAIADLPPRQREAVALRYLRRLSIRDTAAALGCAEGTVKSTVAAALERLRYCLRNER